MINYSTGILSAGEYPYDQNMFLEAAIRTWLYAELVDLINTVVEEITGHEVFG